MERYDPSQAVDSEAWQVLDESVRIDLIQAYHRDNGEELPENAKKLHAVIHVIVENQLAQGVEPVPSTLAKLTRQGLDRHEAIYAIGAVLAEDIFELLQSNEASNFHQRYRKRLEKLTAKRWKKGQW